MTGILEGVKVIDMGAAIAMPSAALTLGDWGAEVIRLEALTVDMPRRPRVEWAADYQVSELTNRNKKAIAVNLKKERGQEILHKLAQRADIFMGSYEQSALKKLKADYATLSQINPGIIYVLLTGYGTVGPDKDDRGYDYAASWARSGAQYQIGEPGIIPPMNLWGFGDRVAASHIVGGTMAALWHREKTGKGQELEVSLYHSGVWSLASDVQSALMGAPPPKFERARTGANINPLWNSYRTKDGRWFQLSTQGGLHWPELCRALERPDLEKDPRVGGGDLSKNVDALRENCAEVISIFDEIFASRTMKEWEKRFKENDVIYGLVATPMEVTQDPQALANNFFAELDTPARGKIRVVTTPVTFRQNPSSVRTPAPELGQNTEEILLDLGYSWEDIAQFKEQGVIL